MVVLSSKVLRLFGAFSVRVSLFFVLPILAASTLAEDSASLVFDSPSDDEYVSSRFPVFKLRLENAGDLDDLSVVFGDKSLPTNVCTFEKSSGIAYCTLSVSLDNGWQEVSALLYSGNSLVAQASISVAVDLDEDGIPDHLDQCGNTVEKEKVNLNGCSPIQLDSDGDGVSNVDEFLQILPAINMLLSSSPAVVIEEPQPLDSAIEDGLTFESPAHKSLVKSGKPSVRLRANISESTAGAHLSILVDGVDTGSCNFDDVTALGTCELSQPLLEGWHRLDAHLLRGDSKLASAAISIALDTDEDGIPNHEDYCSNTPLSETVDGSGCGASQIDSDSDGIVDVIELEAGSNPYSRHSYPAVIIQSFSALPEQISRAGDSAGLSWSVSGATSVVLRNSADDTTINRLPLIGTARVSPQAATTYTLKAIGPGGTKSSQVEISIVSDKRENQWGISPLDQIGEAVSSSLTLTDDGGVFLGAFDGNYYRFTSSGNLAWVMEDVGIVMNKAAVSDSTVYIGTNSASGGRILALSSKKEVLWDEMTQAGVVASPVLNQTKSILYVATYNGTILGFNTENGTLIWSFKLPEGETISATPMLTSNDEILYIHSNSHKIFAVRVKPENGSQSDDTQQIILEPNDGTNSGTPLLWESDISSPSN
ncbi:PQQ-binding-like beta-propeller repeat protein [Microbulbifer sp. EKSA008]|uniref:outer membrane protein assembly factor BamB family protein n=1 Tax=Microbulbifer sp. EKSA008 TaxID=3243367 RepID=UPI004040EBC5